MMYTKEQLEDYLKQKGEALDIKSFFSEGTRKEDYRPYFKSEEELNIWVSFPENMNLSFTERLEQRENFQLAGVSLYEQFIFVT